MTRAQSRRCHGSLKCVISECETVVVGSIELFDCGSKSAQSTSVLYYQPHALKLLKRGGKSVGEARFVGRVVSRFYARAGIYD
jgi:hypothetical protein